MNSLERKIPKLEYANKLIFVRSYEKAMQIIKELVDDKHFSNNPLIHLRRIELATKLDSLSEVRKDLEALICRDPDSLSFHSLLILLELHDDHASLELVEAQIEALHKKTCELPEFLYACAFAMELNQNWTRAKFFYEKCIEKDPSWYPAFFGLSQIYYQTGDDLQGDQYFVLFEEAAPFNVYGNFETHRNLAEEFISVEQYEEAEEAIKSLAEWWVENRGKCPDEIKIFEFFSLSRIFGKKGDYKAQRESHDSALLLAEEILSDESSTESMLLFIARVAEDFDNSELALRCYKAILKLETKSPEMVQRIGSQFFSINEYSLAHDLFYEAYTHQPDNAEIRFCLLVSKLKLAGANVEEYLIGKERLKSLDSEENSVELLSLLHAMLANYDEDPDVHAFLGDLYYNLANHSKAAEHFDSMIKHDSYSLVAKLKLASFLVNTNNYGRAEAILEGISVDLVSAQDRKNELNWLKSLVAYNKGEFNQSIHLINKSLANDSWNVAFIVHKCLSLSRLFESKISINAIDPVLIKLSKSDESDLEWKSYDSVTEALLRNEFFELVYERERIKFLYQNQLAYSSNRLLHAAVRYDAGKACSDFLKLINTNFDAPSVYWVLGMFRKELFQFEAARAWFEHLLQHTSAKTIDQSFAYLDTADCLLWQDIEAFKAMEYARLSIDLNPSPTSRNYLVLAHAYLKVGKPQQAVTNLHKVTSPNEIEAIYIRGLVFYRNGDLENAKKHWDPILSSTSLSLKDHLIKEAVQRYYFERKHYLQSN